MVVGTPMPEMPSPDAAPGDRLLKDRPYLLDEEATRCALRRADRSLRHNLTV